MHFASEVLRAVAQPGCGPDGRHRPALQRSHSRPRDGSWQGASSRIRDGQRRDVGAGLRHLPRDLHPPCPGPQRNGSIHFVFMDWRHLPELLNAARPFMRNGRTSWSGTRAMPGKEVSTAPSTNSSPSSRTGPPPTSITSGSGRRGDTAPMFMDYPSVNSLHPARRGDLELHPTSKAGRPNCRSDPGLQSAQRPHSRSVRRQRHHNPRSRAHRRVARVIELDPLYVDVAIRRWERATGVARASRRHRPFLFRN